ncbi:MAG: nuclease-related domain-containing protein [Clostridium sp.]
MSKYFKRGYYIVGAIIMVFIIYKVSLFFLNIGLDSVSRQLFFISMCFYLYIPLMSYVKSKSEVVKTGILEEQMVKEELEILKEGCTVLHGVYIKDGEEKIEIDSLVISDKGIFNIYVKKLSGEITIKENEVWKFKRYGNIEYSYAPIEGVKKNRRALASVVDEEKIIDLVVIAGDGVSVEGSENSSVPVVMYNDLVEYINNYETDERYDVEKLYEEFYPSLDGESTVYEKELKYEDHLNKRWIFRGRFAVVTVFLGLYLANIMYLG